MPSRGIGPAESDSERMDEVIDQLTGLLAGDTLAPRARQLAHQSRRCGEPVGVIVAELDGPAPAAGEARTALLRELARVVLDSLRAFDLAYRDGEARFVVLLPGADHERTADTAERLRRSVEAAGLPGGATMSFGVGASREGWGFDYDSVRLEAEAGLEEAKLTGNGVRGGGRRPA